MIHDHQFLRAALELHGQEIVEELISTNAGHLLSIAEVGRKYCWAAADLISAIEAGRVIACRRDDGCLMFPAEQFGTGGVHEWAAAITRTVGNGPPALHFLYVSRTSLGSSSIAELLRKGDEKAACRAIRAVIRKLKAD